MGFLKPFNKHEITLPTEHIHVELTSYQCVLIMPLLYAMLLLKEGPFWQIVINITNEKIWRPKPKNPMGGIAEQFTSVEQACLCCYVVRLDVVFNTFTITTLILPNTALCFTCVARAAISNRICTLVVHHRYILAAMCARVLSFSAWRYKCTCINA